MKIFMLDKYHVAKASDQKKQLAGWSQLNSIESLTDMQKTKMNSLAVGDRSRALKWLSPKQLELLRVAE